MAKRYHAGRLAPVESSPVSTQPPDSLVAPLLRELSIAWQALVSYPPGHPLAAAAVERAVGRLGERLADGPLELLAGRDALLWGDHRLAGPTAVRLAELLRRRNAAAVRFDPGVDAREVERFLRGLVVEGAGCVGSWLHGGDLLGCEEMPVTCSTIGGRKL